MNTKKYFKIIKGGGFMKTKFILKGLNCPNCSAKIVDDIKKYEGIKDVNYDLVNQMLYVEHEE